MVACKKGDKGDARLRNADSELPTAAEKIRACAGRTAGNTLLFFSEWGETKIGRNRKKEIERSGELNVSDPGRRIGRAKGWEKGGKGNN